MANYAKPTPQARAFKIHGTNQNGLRRARQIASQRRYQYEKQPTRCICCGAERDPKSHPVCALCTQRRKEGVR